VFGAPAIFGEQRMAKLELRVPPPIVAALAAAAMWLLAFAWPPVAVGATARVAAAAVVAIAGGAFSAAGVLAFRRARTSASPMKPECASSLVTTGVYSITRNPMYVGLFLVLVAWAVFLASPASLVGPVAFVAYIGRFQIEPEERALSAMFGPVYAKYKSSVRRWL
jgi:protein-S-isoprenylcysteine O-methyltransferase Ste14